MRSLRKRKSAQPKQSELDLARFDADDAAQSSPFTADDDDGEEWFNLGLAEVAEDGSGVQRHSLRRNATALMGSQMATWVLALVLTTFQSRILGPGGLGQLRIANALWNIAAVFVGLGASNMIIVTLARDHTRASIVNRAVALQSLVYVVSWPVVLGLALAVGYNSSILLTVALVGGSVMFTTLSADARAAFYGFEQMTPSSVVDIIGRVFTTVLTVVVILCGGRTQASAALITVTASFHVVLISRRLRRSTGCTLRPKFIDLRAIGRAGLPFLLIEATLIVYQQVDTVIMSLLVKSDELGYYGAATQMFGTLLFIPTVLMSTVFPVFARLDESDPAALVTLTRRGLRFLLLAGVPIGLGTVGLGQPICTLIFGHNFRPAGDVLSIYGFVIIIMFPIILLSQYSVATGRQARWAMFLVVGIVLTVPLDLVTVPLARRWFGHGAAGGALSFIVTESIILTLACTTIARHLLDRSVLRRTILCLVIGAAMLGAIWPLREMFLGIPVIVGATVYGALIAVLRVLDPDEADLIRAMRRRLTGAIKSRRSRR